VPAGSPTSSNVTQCYATSSRLIVTSGSLSTNFISWTGPAFGAHSPISTRALRRKGWYSKQKLSEFVKSASKSHKTEDDDVLQYYRRLLILSKPLLDSRRLTEEERDAAFWYGFHQDDRSAMTARLIAKHLDQSEGRAFDCQDLFKMARAVFTGQQFFSPWQDQWDDYGDRDPRERDDLLRTHERELRPLGRRTRECYQEEDPFSLAAPVRYKDPSRNNKNKVVDDLLDQMSSLSLCDHPCPTLHARCTYRYPDVAKNLP
jgi:hypothetical protein